MNTGTELRMKRNAAGIAGSLVCMKAGISRSRLSDIERGYAPSTPNELAQINTALEELVRAKSAIEQTAAAVGWPVAEVAP